MTSDRRFVEPTQGSYSLVLPFRLVELDVSGGKWTSLLVPLREKIHQTITEVVSAQQNRIHLEKDKYMEEGWHFYNFAVLQVRHLWYMVTTDSSFDENLTL